MKTFCVPFIALLFSSLLFATVVCAADLNGLWTKTTSPDPNNIAIFYHEKNDIKAMGYSEIDGGKVVWYAEGKIDGNVLRCTYRHAKNATPPGWAQEGVMDLTLSADSSAMTGTAKSRSGDWSGAIGFVRARLFPPLKE